MLNIKMLVSFLYPYRLRNTIAPHLWFFYYQLSKINDENIIYIGSKDYFLNPNYFKKKKRFEMEMDIYEIPSKERLMKISKKEIPKTLFQDLEKIYLSSNKAWKSLINERYKPLEDILEKYFLEIGTDNIEGILSTCNCASLTYIANKYDLKIIHNELGALREPLFKNTAYFDFSGVNGNTEFLTRLKKFKEEIQNEKFKYLGFEKLIEKVGTKNLTEILKNEVKEQYSLGIAFQVEGDSNLIAYSNGYDSLDLINIAQKEYSKESILLRKHPGSSFDISNKYGDVDNYRYSCNFLKKSKTIICINSSIAVEALFFKKNIFLLGESSFKIFSSNNLLEAKKLDEKVLEYYCIGYLIPFEFMYDYKYIKFRLKKPKELEIYEYHLSYWRTYKKQIYEEGLEKIIVKNFYELELEKKSIELEEKKEELKKVKNSNSWKLTSPLRRIIFEIKKIRGKESLN